MAIATKLGTALAALLFTGGCYHGAQVKAVQLTEPGTYVVATPGALSLAQQSGTAQRICTMRLPPGHGKAMNGKHGKSGKAGKRDKAGGKRGRPGRQGQGSATRGPGGGPGNAGGPAMLDTLMFRLCEARSNGDITAPQYQELLKGMLELAKERAAAPRGPGGPAFMQRPQGRPGMGPGMRPRRRGGWGDRSPDMDGPEDDGDEKSPDESKKPDAKPKGK